LNTPAAQAATKTLGGPAADMFAVELIPRRYVDLIAVGRECTKIMAVVFASELRKASLEPEVIDELVDPVLFSVVHEPRSSESFQRHGNEIANAGEKVDAHIGAKTVCLITADHQKSDFGFVAERHECHRADFLCSVAKQELHL